MLEDDEDLDVDGVDTWDDEPVGSCDWCGINLFEWDDSELCDQCLWHALQSEPLDEDDEDLDEE